MILTEDVLVFEGHSESPFAVRSYIVVDFLSQLAVSLGLEISIRMRLRFNRMRPCLRISIRPLFFLILLGFSIFIVTYVPVLINQTGSNLRSEVDEVYNKTISEIENSAKMLLPLNSSALNLARALSISLNGTEISFSIIQAKITPPLFQALATIPRVAEVSYTGLDRLAFSYYLDNDQTLAVFSNTSSSSLSYIQPVNRDTGKLFGEAVSSNSTHTFNLTWFQFYSNWPFNKSSLPEGSDRTTQHLSLEMGKNARNLLFKTTVPMDGRGQISIGFPAAEVNNQFSHVDFHGGHLHLATNDGKVLVESKLPDAQISVDNGTVSLILKKPNGDHEDLLGKVSCKSDDGDSVYLDVKIREKKHKFYCSTITVAGVDSVYALIFPADGMEAAALRNNKLAIFLVVLMVVGTVISLGIFILLIVKAARTEIVLCDALIKQKESTQQAERKSMSKTNAFAMNSHDLRSSLAVITNLIDVCRQEAAPNSSLATNLFYIKTYVLDLLGLLNTVLDQSKIEAGKIELVEEEFNLAQVLEEVVDMYYPVGMKKGVDIILDPCDGSILKFNLVRGDRQRLKEILENLLSNAIKFTSEGHVVVRITIRKTSEENAIIASNSKSILKCLLCYKNTGSLRSLDDIHTVHENPNCMEFIFEVEDTGCGIPKERQKSVFENYVQVKPASEESGQKGWGLGLGIVQSLVRLMGGEIKIVDKENGERGTCFRFNIFLTTCNPVSDDTHEHGNHIPDGASSTDLLRRSHVTRLEGSHVVLLLSGKERRKVSKKVIENFGIKVSVVERSKDLERILDRMTERMEFSSERSESSSNENLSTSCNINEGCSGTKDGQDSILPQRKSWNSKGLHNFILIVVDAVAGSSLDVISVLSNFKKEQCKVVWLENHLIRNSNSSQLEKEMPLPDGIYKVNKTLHGSILYQVLGLLPEFGGAFPPASFKFKGEVLQEIGSSTELEPSIRYTQSSSNVGVQECIISPDQTQQLQEIVIHDQTNDQSTSTVLKGKAILIVDDQGPLRLIGSATLSKLGAKVDVCENGRLAFDKVYKALNDEGGIHQKALPYDYILMDCQMPVMDGYQATRLIREEEKLHGIHIPIFALTANTPDENNSNIVDAGMDFHLCKPFQVVKLLDAIKAFECKSEH
ncbi:hypothetical protein ACH5RR_001626 [Cinchona calisaya]|uniref:histidine kinase n=1 Tax=Cinchona calisaya TaxID=153742 RepID=A0ABD3B3Y4_9GENT